MGRNSRLNVTHGRVPAYLGPELRKELEDHVDDVTRERRENGLPRYSMSEAIREAVEWWLKAQRFPRLKAEKQVGARLEVDGLEVDAGRLMNLVESDLPVPGLVAFDTLHTEFGQFDRVFVHWRRESKNLRPE